MRLDDTRPIWVQLVDELRLRVVSGEWQPGERIPSVRELAADAGVNPNTVQRALAELDRTGLTTAERTAGRFVTTDRAAVDRARRELAAGAVDSFIGAVSALGMDLDEARAVLAERWEGAPPGAPGAPAPPAPSTDTHAAPGGAS